MQRARKQETASPGWRRAARAGMASLVSAALIAGELSVVLVGFGALSTASAQDSRYPHLQRGQRRPPPPQQQPSFGIPFFGGWGSSSSSRSMFSDPFRNPFDRGGYDRGGYDRDQDYRPRERPVAPADFSKAPPAPRKEIESATTVVVLGDSMADWLAYGLEDAFSDTPEVGVVRKHRTGSSLIRTEARESYDWVQGAKDALVGDRVDFAVMMIGLGDRTPIRERQPARGIATKPAEAKPAETASRETKPGETAEQPSAVAPEPERPERPGQLVSHEFRSEKWVELYTKRLDDTIAALKARRVPVLWVGLPPVRGPRARSDLSFLNDLFKDRAEKAGIVYIDIWDGFVDESGEFSTFGPDIIGQNRRLRTGDGVHFTKAGARKLAHYVDREIRRQLERATPVALPVPAEPMKPTDPTAPSGPAPRPVAGPVVPLTGHTPATEGLLGGNTQAPGAVADPVAARVMVQGETIEPAQNRADNFAWPRSTNAVADVNAIEAPLPEPPAAAAAPRPVVTTTRPAPPPRTATQSAATPARTVR